MDDELMARQQPQSLEAEQAVLGSILIDSRCITDIIGILKPEDFYQEQNREIYEQSIQCSISRRPSTPSPSWIS